MLSGATKPSIQTLSLQAYGNRHSACFILKLLALPHSGIKLVG